MPDGKEPSAPFEKGLHARHVRTSDAPGGPSVLVVDDVEDNRDLYATYFEHSGFRASEARDGEEALAIIAQDMPDVVIMDLAMPRLDGWEATRLIKSNPRTAQIIVIVVTGTASNENLERARAAGANEVCTKPCLPRDLMGIVRTLLDERERRIPSVLPQRIR
jgi:CheY-like chemotaxis protein